MGKFKHAVFLIIASIMLLISGCGGSGAGSDGNSTEVRISLDKVMSDLGDGNDADLGVVQFTSISLDVYKPDSHNDFVRHNILEAINSGERYITIDNLDAETAYTFALSVYGPKNILLCGDSASALIIADTETEVELHCVFDDEAVIDAMAYETAKFFVSDSDKTAEDYEIYIASDNLFGMDDGISRAEFIQRELDDPISNDSPSAFADSSIDSKTKISDTEYKLKLKLTYADGSYDYATIRALKENSQWKMGGNNYLYYLKFIPTTVKVNSYLGVTETKAAFYVDASNEGGHDFEYITVTGTSLPADGAKLVPDAENSSMFVFDSTYYQSQNSEIISSPALYPLSDAEASAIADNSVYTFKAYSSSDELLETRTVTIKKRPFLSTEVTSAYFAEAENINPDITAYENTDFSVSVKRPTAFTPRYIKARLGLDYTTDFVEFERALPVNTDTTVTFNTNGLPLPEEAKFVTVSITPEDRQTMEVWAAGYYQDDNGTVIGSPPAAEMSSPQDGDFIIPNTDKRGFITAKDEDGYITEIKVDFGNGNIQTFPQNLQQSVVGQDFSPSYPSEGTYTMTVTVTDNDGNQSSQDYRLTITNNAPPYPEVMNTYPEQEGTVTINTPVTFYADIITSNNQPPALLDWYIDGEKYSESSPTLTFNELGQKWAVFVVEDPNGANFSVNLSFTVVEENTPPQPNTPPVAVIVSPSEGYYSINEQISFYGQGTDSDGTVESISWLLGDGNFMHTESFTYAYSTPGAYRIYLTIGDDDEAYSGDTLDILVQDAGKPVVKVDSPMENGIYYAGDIVDFKAEAYDNSSVDMVEWNTGDGNMAFDNETARQYQNGGTYTVSYTAFDDSGADTTVTFPISIVTDTLGLCTCDTAEQIGYILSTQFATSGNCVSENTEELREACFEIAGNSYLSSGQTLEDINDGLYCGLTITCQTSGAATYR
jgi:hypothetical protein